MLAGCEAVQYLIDRQLINSSCCLSDKIRVRSASRRHHNFHVTGLSGGDYFLKQGKHSVDVGSIANEAHAYTAILGQDSHARMRKYLPAVRDYDETRGIITLEAIPHAQDLEHYHTQTRRFPKTVAKSIGTALGILHDSTFAWSTRKGAEPKLTKVLPTVFNLRHPPLDILKTSSGVCLELIKLFQRHTQFGDELEALSKSWKAETVIHGDLKLSNFVTYKKKPHARISGVKLVDWEFAGLGDPHWDVGSVFNSYLALWILSVPIAKHDRPDELLNLALFPLERIQPSFRIFWETYCKTRGLYGQKAQTWLYHATRLAAVCLVQTAYEYAKNANYLTAEIVTMMQVSLNMFLRPDQAAIHLLGIDG